MASNATNLASEFYVISILHRIGVSAALTLGNKKSVDIIVAKGQGEAITIDVKGASGNTGFFVNNQMSGKNNHFVIFVSFHGKFSDVSLMPEVHVVPSCEIRGIAKSSPSGKNVVHLTDLRKLKKYKDAWHLI